MFPDKLRRFYHPQIDFEEARMHIPEIIAHRGASADAPENTMAAFRLARAQGAQWIELDVMLSGDLKPVVLHDETMHRTASDERAVRDLSLEDLQKLEVGSWFSRNFTGERIPVLQDVLSFCAHNGMGMNLEIKPGAGLEQETARQICAVLLSTPSKDLPPILLSSFAWEALEVASQLTPDIPRACLAEALTQDAIDFAEREKCISINLGNDHIQQEDIERIASTGKKTLVYTVNNPARAKQLLSWGVTSLFSDVPGQMLKALS